MLRLPPSIERRLSELFPDRADREHFVARVIEDALQQKQVSIPSNFMIPQQLPLVQGELPLEGDHEEDAAVGGTLHLFSDGGSRGNPGQASIACIVEDPKRGVLLRQHAERIGVETNNVAEYKALIKGLKIAQEYHPNRLICHLDSELIVQQMNGQYQVKVATLQPLFEEVRSLSLNFPDIIFKHIPRSDNYRADALVNKVLNEGRSSYERERPTTFSSRGIF